MSLQHDAKPEAPDGYDDTPELAAAWKEGHRVGQLHGRGLPSDVDQQGCWSILPVKTQYLGGATVAAAPPEEEKLSRDVWHLACAAHGWLVSKGGFTIDEMGHPAEGDLWAVSVKDKGKIYPGCPSTDEIHAYLRDTPLDGQWFGGWFDAAARETHLDCTELYSYKHTAVQVAEENGQKSIYNIKTGETIYIPQKAPVGYDYDCDCGISWDAAPSLNAECENCGAIVGLN